MSWNIEQSQTLTKFFGIFNLSKLYCTEQNEQLKFKKSSTLRKLSVKSSMKIFQIVATRNLSLNSQVNEIGTFWSFLVINILTQKIESILLNWKLLYTWRTIYWNFDERFSVCSYIERSVWMLGIIGIYSSFWNFWNFSIKKDRTF